MNSEKQIIVTDCMCCSARIDLYHSEANDIIFSFVASQFFFLCVPLFFMLNTCFSPAHNIINPDAIFTDTFFQAEKL